MKPNTVGRAAGNVPQRGKDARGLRAVNDTPCLVGNGLLAGTRLLTLDGELPVEFLSPGDRIITRDVGMVMLDDIRVIDATCECVTIRAGSLGHTRPGRDMVLPASQRVYLRDWRAQALFGTPTAMVHARRLADGNFVSIGERRRVRLVKLIFQTPHVLYADGVEVESALPALS